ncbi:MAG: hypothetical protein EZS28_045690 [Streblomastix strix]|uniref:Uncharacterized protein n=1 Tax=Streblomastix strix TaxID=222440 RepID=A0A5J4TLZ6_9EUKA|nr:MAG: hypothetical protein EZS28_045690 [Streblomastix strix]
MMTYYALGQYAVYISGPIDQDDIKSGLYSKEDLEIPRAPNNDALNSTIQVLLQGMINKKKNLQKSACTALEMVILQASKKMMNYVQVLIQVLNAAFTQYHISNTRLLCNIITALSDAVGKAGLIANEGELIKALMTMLQQKLQDRCSLEDEV